MRYQAATPLRGPGPLLQKVLSSFKSSTVSKGARSSSVGAECISAPTPDIPLVPTARTGPPVRNGHCLPHQREVAGLQFLGLPLRNRSLKDTLQPQGYRASSWQVGDASWALLRGGKSSTQADPLPIQMIEP